MPSQSAGACDNHNLVVVEAHDDLLKVGATVRVTSSNSIA